MKIVNKILILLFVLFTSVFFIGNISHAQTGSTAPILPPQPSSAMSQNSSVELYNPISNQGSLTGLLLSVMKVFLGIVGLLSVTFVVIGGFRMIVSQGNTEAVETARNTITWAILGLIISVLSFAAVAIIQNLIGVKGG